MQQENLEIFLLYQRYVRCQGFTQHNTFHQYLYLYFLHISLITRVLQIVCIKPSCYVKHFREFGWLNELCFRVLPTLIWLNIFLLPTENDNSLNIPNIWQMVDTQGNMIHLHIQNETKNWLSKAYVLMFFCFCFVFLKKSKIAQ